MENFIVSARKYRPDNFRSVVGQGAITATLRNAIKNNHLGHAYLFSGPRGVGKTTCARIFAKTINCKNLSENVEACNECESCKSFNENRAYNIHELDAASNNSVDDIRSLTEQVRIPPQVGKYSVYIIDEVHMLSQQAFNAFLKTLEEPPAHAIFILATTEKHKIIPTILSRCQIYDFNRIKTNDAVDYLKYIAGEEGISFEDDALHIIAQKAEGAMRDALSIFDQVVSFSEKSITYAAVIENLNILDVEYYFRLAANFLENNVSSVLLTFNEILEKGFDPRNFMSGLASHLRDLLVSKDEATAVLLDVGANIREQYLEHARAMPVEFLYEALEICNEADLQFRGSKNQRLTIELALVRLTNLTMVQKKKIADETPDPQQDNASPPPSGPGTPDRLQASESTSDQPAGSTELPRKEYVAVKTTPSPAEGSAPPRDASIHEGQEGAPASGDRKESATASVVGKEGAAAAGDSRKTDSAPGTGEDKTSDQGSGAKAAPASDNKGDEASAFPGTGEETPASTGKPEAAPESNGKENQVVHTRSVSIKGVLKGQPRPVPLADGEISENDQVDKAIPAAPDKVEITEEMIQKAWKAYAASIEKSHPRIFTTLSQQVPRLTDKGIIRISLATEAQRENFIHRIKPALTRFLQNTIADVTYVFETDLLDNETTVKKVYTDQDKLDYLINKNPDLEKMKSRFNLDFDN